ncbi:TPA: hypothetical protein ACX6RM_003212 [Photobacterium damselae]
MENKLQSNTQQSKDFKAPIFLDKDLSPLPVPTFCTPVGVREKMEKVMEKIAQDKASKLQSKS